jgi:large subunit ribosomal protein LP2
MALFYFLLMKYLAAYALLVLGGNENPTADDIKKVLTEVGITADDTKLTALMSAMKGKKLHEVISAGLSQVSLNAPSNMPAQAKVEEKAAEKTEEKVEAKPVAEDADMGDAMKMFED